MSRPEKHNEKGECFIYALADPDTDTIRYIGKTRNLYDREHKHNTELGRTRKDQWIKQLKSQGNKPILKVLEECNEENWHKREKYFIKKLYQS